MQFTSEQYYHASLERLKQARTIYQEGDAYSLAVYCGGVAVESLLRAFLSKGRSFDGRHDLLKLLKAGSLLQIHDNFMREKGAPEETIRLTSVEFRTAMNEIIILWHNNLRYASEAALKTHLNHLGKLRGIKGDPLKKNTRDLLEAAQQIINRGVALWTSNRRF